jgi:hypothetical protein
MLDLDDRLWLKLDDALFDRDIPKQLSELESVWNEDTAMSLFWDCLCHQGTCYAATYASIPHLIRIAQPPPNQAQRFEIALFLGNVIIRAFDGQPDFRGEAGARAVQGLPDTTEDWNRMLESNRGLTIAQRERVSHDRLRGLLTIGRSDHSDFAKIAAIKAGFIAALPAIRNLCETALVENPNQPDATVHLLAGVAAADGLLRLARLLNFGREGLCKCPACGTAFEYQLYADRVALYEDANARAKGQRGSDPAVLDFQEGAPSRANGFLRPVSPEDALDPRSAALLSLAARAPDNIASTLLRNFLGTFPCPRCGGEESVESI